MKNADCIHINAVPRFNQSLYLEESICGLLEIWKRETRRLEKLSIFTWMEHVIQFNSLLYSRLFCEKSSGFTCTMLTKMINNNKQNAARCSLSTVIMTKEGSSGF